ncbi:MAG: hypothetical protein ACRDK0_06110, partial [Solirubrobacteraceae bacterium]
EQERHAAPRDLRPESLRIRPPELECMEQLSVLLGRSPRGLKRFLNTYRLLKSRAPDLDAFLREDRPLAHYRAVLFLLALCTGAPSVAAKFIDEALEGGPATLAQRLPEISAPDDERDRVRAWLQAEAGAQWSALTLAQLQQWAAEVVRFTFHWHRAPAPPATGPPPSPGTRTPAA